MSKFDKLDLPLRPVPRGEASGWMADALRTGQEGMNKVLRHEESGFGLGDLILGEAPRLMDNISHGDMGVKRTGHGFKLDPAWMDLGGVAAIPSSGILGAGKATGKLMSKALREGAKAPVDEGRRKVLKGLGTGAAALALPSVALRAMKEGGKDAVKTAAGVAAKTAAKSSLAIRGVALGAIRSLGTGTRLELVDSAKVLAKMDPKVLKPIEKRLDSFVAKYGDDFDPDEFVKRSEFSGQSMSEKELGLKPWRGGMDDNPADKYLDSLPTNQKDEVVERWYATGKWPKGKEDTMKYWDRQAHIENMMDSDGVLYGQEKHLNDLFQELNKLVEETYSGVQKFPNDPNGSWSMSDRWNTTDKIGSIKGDKVFND